MIGNENNIMASRWTCILLVLIALCIIDAGPAHAALSCSACHTMPPLDSVAGEREPSSGAFRGNHQGHSSNSVDSCVPCHGAEVTSYEANHSAPPPGSGSKPVIRLTPALNNYSIGSTGTQRATYSRGTFFNQTSVPPSPLGTCSNVNCHFEATTPAWGTPNFTLPTDCDKCHGAPPSAIDPGSHTKHADSYPGVTNCQKCHPNNTTFQHATSAGNRPLGISFAASPNNGSGSYTGPLNDYLPSQNNTFGDCSATYCHGTTMSPNGGTDITPTWGTAATGQCGTCHGATTTTPPVLGSHRTHAGTGEWTHAPGGLNDKIYGRGIACSKCHKTGSGDHVNGNAEWSFNSISSPWLSGARYRGLSSGSVSGVPSASYGTCTNLYCHSIVQTNTGGPLTGLAGEYKTVTWGNMDEGTCGSCHAVDLGHATWAGRGGADEIASASHTKHLQAIGATAGIGSTPGGPARCAVCHNYGNTDDLLGCSATCHVSSTPLHVNHQIEIKFAPRYDGGSASYTGSPTPGSGFGGCTTTYCHSNGLAVSPSYAVPVWGNTASAACGTCHGANSATPPASQRHTRHVGGGSPYVYACALCHAGIVRHNANATTLTSISSAQFHVNKSRDVKFDALNSFGNYSSVNLSCNSAYCHSIGNNSVAAGSLPGAYNGKIYAKPKWTDAGPLACNACHGRSTGNGMPDYANGGVGNTANSHLRHVSTGNIACVECHEKTTKSNTSIRSISPSKHVDGTSHDVYFNLSSNSKLGTYDNGAKTCSNTYCHGAAPSAAWGSPTLPCNSCHSANSALPGAHQIHVQTASMASSYNNMSGNVSSTTQYRFSCAACHQPGAGKASHANGPQAGGINGPAEIFYGFTSSTRKGSYTYGGTSAGTDPTGAFSYTAGGIGCETTYCHSNGAGNAGNSAVAWSATASSATNSRCKSCHKYNAASGLTVDTGDHPIHVSGSTYNLSCRKCHAATTIDGATIADNSKHVNKSVNVAFNNTTTAINGTYNGIASPMSKNPGSPYGSCSNTYCHSTGTSTTPAAPNVTPTWNGAFNTTCSGCHGNDNAADFKMGSVGSATHSKHVQSYSYGCVKCHAATASNNRSISSYANHVDRQVNVAFNNRTTAINGTYNGVASPMAKLPGSAFGSCTNTYCHSPGDKATLSANYNPPAVVPVWGGASLTCKDCHKADYASGSSIATGSHTGHINKFGWGANTTRCVKCHAVTAKSNMTIASVSRHVNGQIEIAFDSTSSAANGTYKGTLATPASPMTKAPGSATGQCANVYCHSTGQGDNASWPPTYSTTPAWGTSDMEFCGKCHATQYAHGGSFGVAAPLATGSHAKHFNYTYVLGMSEYEKCVVCHAYQRTGITPGSGCAGCHSMTAFKHANYEINVGIPDYYGASAKYDKATTKPGVGYYSTCSTVYCHSDGLATPVSYYTPTWGVPASGACGTCHGAKADSPPASARHAKHVGVGPYSYACALCHVGIVKHNANATTYALISTSTDFTYVNGSRLHVNKARDVRFDSAMNPFGHYSTANQTCISAYCHSIGNTKVVSARLPAAYNGKIYARPKWTDVGPLSCNACHGRSTSNGMPDYTNGKMGSMSSNSHPKHVTSSALACVECHEKTTKTGTTIRSTFPSKHVNSTNHDVFFNQSSLNKNGTYDDVQRKCSNTYCHGVAASVAWGGTTSCASCHEATGSGAANLALRHDKHYNSATAPTVLVGGTDAHTATAYVFSCLNCHPSNQHATGPASTVAPLQDAYVSGTKITAYTKGAVSAADTKGYNYTDNGTCTTVCHTRDGVTAGSAITPSPAWNGANAAGCGYCHNKAGDAGPVWSSPHTKHINTYAANTNFTCASCHAGTATNSTTINGASGRNQHPNANRDLAMNAFATGDSVTIAGAQGSQTCANTYCHSPGTSLTASAGTHTAVSWSGNTNCASCHTGGTTTGPSYANNSPKTNSHAKHTVAANNVNSVNTAYVCVNCHAATVNASNEISDFSKHVNKAYDVSGSRITTYTYVSNGGTCSTSCHGKTTPKWGETSTGCNFCHPYDVGSWNLTSQRWTSQLSATSEGFGAHEKHIAHIKGLVGIAGSMNLLTGFGAAGSDATKVCGACHTKALANHVDAGNARSINFADGAYTYGIGGFGLSFGGNPSYGGTSASSSSVNPKNCLNTSCHTGTAPVWAPY